MKRQFQILWVALWLFLLAGCTEVAQEQNLVQVSIQQAPGFTVTDNGQWLCPGEDAMFLLTMEPGLRLTEIDYDGEYITRLYGNQVELILQSVRYPTHLNVTVTDDACTITYNGAGGVGPTGQTEITMAYDLTYHLRPNTETGWELFSRPGHTLAGWNSAADGSGQSVGLGSRVSVPEEGMTLYAQWEKWSEESLFTFDEEETGLTITGYLGSEEHIVIPETVEGRTVTTIAAGAFQDCGAEIVSLPPTIRRVEDDAFQRCKLTTLRFCDNILYISDRSFSDCPNFSTLAIRAYEAPYGYLYRRESLYADKVDALIEAQGRKKLVFYGGCSTWYNLDEATVNQKMGSGYTLVNMGLNGTINSPIQMQIMGAFLEEGDILVHTPEISSTQQLLIHEGMFDGDKKLWSGLEYNYDLMQLVDIRSVEGILDSFLEYLQIKNDQSSYQAHYTDSEGRSFFSPSGCIPFLRTMRADNVVDEVELNPSYIREDAMDRLAGWYRWFEGKGVRVYVSYACVNMDVVPQEQRGNVELMDSLFREALEATGTGTLISSLSDYLYGGGDYFDTNYHLLSEPARENTEKWLRDLAAQMEKDGLPVP